MLYLYPQIRRVLSEVDSDRRDDETSDNLLFKERVRSHFGLTDEQTTEKLKENQVKPIHNWAVIEIEL